MFGPRPNIWYNSKWSHIPTASLWKHATAFKVFVCHTESYYHDCAVMLSHAVYWCCKSFKYACCHLALASAFEFERLLPSAPTFSAYRSMMLRVLYIGCHGQNTNLPLHALKQIEILIDVAKAKLIARRDVQYLAALTNQCVGMRTRSLFWLLVVGAFCVPSSFSCAFHAGGVLLQCQYIVSSLPLSFLHRCLYLMLAPLLPYRMPSCMSSLRPQMTPTTQLLQCCWCCQKLGGVLWEGHLRFQSHDSNETKCVPTLSKDSINSIHCSTGTFTFGAPWKCENVEKCGKMSVLIKLRSGTWFAAKRHEWFMRATDANKAVPCIDGQAPWCHGVGKDLLRSS